MIVLSKNLGLPDRKGLIRVVDEIARFCKECEVLCEREVKDSSKECRKPGTRATLEKECIGELYEDT